jgi:hypothetical protein
LKKPRLLRSKKILVQKFEKWRYNIAMNLLFVFHQFFLAIFVQQDSYTPKNISIKSTPNKIQYSTQLILVLIQYFKKVFDTLTKF